MPRNQGGPARAFAHREASQTTLTAWSWSIGVQSRARGVAGSAKNDGLSVGQAISFSIDAQAMITPSGIVRST